MNFTSCCSSPIVTSYAENIKNNVEELADPSILFMNPFMTFESERHLEERLVEEFAARFSIDPREIKEAVQKSWKELELVHTSVQRHGEMTLAYMKQHHMKGIVLAGRPYHIDKEINHGIPELITSYGFAVLTEDSISHLAKPDRSRRSSAESVPDLRVL